MSDVCDVMKLDIEVASEAGCHAPPSGSKSAVLNTPLEHGEPTAWPLNTTSPRATSVTPASTRLVPIIMITTSSWACHKSCMLSFTVHRSMHRDEVDLLSKVLEDGSVETTTREDNSTDGCLSGPL
jgi:hypothetical protein